LLAPHDVLPALFRSRTAAQASAATIATTAAGATRWQLAAKAAGGSHWCHRQAQLFDHRTWHVQLQWAGSVLQYLAIIQWNTATQYNLEGCIVREPMPQAQVSLYVANGVATTWKNHLIHLSTIIGV
jgi:hypothetical protein